MAFIKQYPSLNFPLFLHFPNLFFSSNNCFWLLASIQIDKNYVENKLLLNNEAQQQQLTKERSYFIAILI